MTHIQLQTTLDRRQSERLLGFCLDSGADCFSATLIYWDQRQLQQANADFFDRLDPFNLGQRLLECTVVPEGRDRFTQTECWSLNPQTIKLILEASDGSLTSHETGRFPEDWTFYRDDHVFCGIVSHEQYAFLLLTNDDFERFKPLGLPFTIRD